MYTAVNLENKIHSHHHECHIYMSVCISVKYTLPLDRLLEKCSIKIDFRDKLVKLRRVLLLCAASLTVI